MAELSSFMAGGLKSFQTGYVSSACSAGTGEDVYFVDVTIASVTTGKSIPSFTGTAGMFLISGSDAVLQVAGLLSAHSTSNNGRYATHAVSARLLNATTLRLSVIAAAGTDIPTIKGRWSLAESK